VRSYDITGGVIGSDGMLLVDPGEEKIRSGLDSMSGVEATLMTDTGLDSCFS